MSLVCSRCARLDAQCGPDSLQTRSAVRTAKERPMGSIVVFGATGFTGRLVVSALRDRGVGEVILGGRDEEKLRQLSAEHGGLPYRVADALRPETLAGLVRGARVVVDTAGPFARFGEPVV